MGYKTPRTYVLCGGHSSGFSPADATDYYAGGPLNTMSATATLRKIPIPISGIIRTAMFTTASVTVSGTAEDWVVSLYDGTTLTPIATVALNTATRTWLNDAMTYPVTQGGYVQFKTTTPTWVTNPDGVTCFYALIIEYG
jgi:hypothetical protein